jgi:hypothetical protein
VYYDNEAMTHKMSLLLLIGLIGYVPTRFVVVFKQPFAQAWAAANAGVILNSALNVYELRLPLLMALTCLLITITFPLTPNRKLLLNSEHISYTYNFSVILLWASMFLVYLGEWAKSA